MLCWLLRHLKFKISLFWHFDYEEQLGTKSTVTILFISAVGLNQLRTWNLYTKYGKIPALYAERVQCYLIACGKEL